MVPVKNVEEVSVEKLRWECPAASFTFQTSDEIEPLTEVIGQRRAIEAVKLGLELHGNGYNIFVTGLAGTDRIPTIQQLLEQMKKASVDGTPVMRPLFYDFNEELLIEIDDEYMFGPDLLVAPVTELHAASRKVYLPKGVIWKDAFSGKIFEGGRVVQVETPLEMMPLFIKEGSSVEIN